MRALEALHARLEDALEDVLGIRVLVTLAEPRSLARSEGKAKRVTDLRQVQDPAPEEEAMKKLRQLSLFLENRPGQLRAPCEALGKAGIDVLTMALADTAQFGILRLVVKEWERAKAVLERAGMVVNVTEVLPLEVDDRPGGLAEVLVAIEGAGLGVEYMYGFPAPRRPGKAVLLFRFENPDLALEALAERGIKVVPPEELLVRKTA